MGITSVFGHISSLKALSLYKPKFGRIHNELQNSLSCSLVKEFAEGCHDYGELCRYGHIRQATGIPSPRTLETNKQLVLLVLLVEPKEDSHSTLMYEFSSTLKEKEENWCVPSDLDKCPRFEGRNSTIRRTDRLRE